MPVFLPDLDEKSIFFLSFALMRYPVRTSKKERTDGPRSLADTGTAQIRKGF